jgi:hypothetical protein
MPYKRTLLLVGLLAALFIGVSLVLARGYTTVGKLNIASDGLPITGDIRTLNISPNGRYLVYESYDDNSENTGLFVYDLQLDTKEEVNPGIWGWVSNDGRYIFSLGSSSYSSNFQAIVYDREQKTETVVGTGLNGEPLEGAVSAGAMSPDARYFVYYTYALNPFDGLNPTCTEVTCYSVFIWDRLTDTQERISVNDAEVPAEGGQQGSGFASISDDGNIVLFASDGTNLTDTPFSCTPSEENVCFPLYVRDRAAGTTELVSVLPDGTIAFDTIIPLTMYNFDLSGDGRYAVFMSDTILSTESSDYNVYVRDILNNTTEMVNVDSNEVRIPNSKNAGYSVISYDGRFVMFIGGDGLLYVRDRLEGVTTVASKDTNGNTGKIPHNGLILETIFDWSPAAMSASGDTIVFISASDTLIGTTLGDKSEKLFLSQGEAISTTPTHTPAVELTTTDTAPTLEPTITAQATQSETATPQATLAQTETPASTATASPSTPTPEPTCELILNGGFEIVGDTAKLAANWNGKGLLKDKRVQNKPDKVVAHSGDFAFQFKGSDSGKITQNVASTGDCGNTLTLSAWVEGKNLIGARVQAKVIYTNEPPVKLRLSANELNGTYAYKAMTASLTLTDTVQQIKVQIGMKNGGGRLRIDDVSLNSAVSLLALP